MSKYSKVKDDILQWLKEDGSSEARFSTMFDLYALPTDFPGFSDAQKKTEYEKVEFLENSLAEDIGDHRFVPYIQLHEFEALVLANPGNLALEYFDRSVEIEQLKDLLNQHSGNSELINDNIETAPSKRIQGLIPEYDKVNVGAIVAELNGIDFLKTKCPHFSDWVMKLEELMS